MVKAIKMCIIQVRGLSNRHLVLLEMTTVEQYPWHHSNPSLLPGEDLECDVDAWCLVIFHNIVLSHIGRFSKKKNTDHNIRLCVCGVGLCVCGRGLWTLCSCTGMSATRCKRHKNSLTFHRVMATTTTTKSGLWMSCLPPTVIDPQRSGGWRAFYIVCLHKARQTTKRIMIHYFWLR